MKKYPFVMLLLLCALPGLAQVDIKSLPVNTVASTSDPSAPLIVYLTGDGGWNKFSQALTARLASKGYPVVSLNSNKYFWQKKTPDQLAAALVTLARSYQKQWSRKRIVFVGYSFGADVLPFAYNLLPKDIASEVENVTLLSPSATTDFEIHLMVMLGSKGGGQSVPASINKITDKQVVLIFGEGENEFKNGDLTGKNLVIEKLAGGHHYDGNEANVADKIIQYISKK